MSPEEYVVVPKKKWEARHVAANEVRAVEKALAAMEKRLKDVGGSMTAKRIGELENEIKKMETESLRLRGEVHDLTRRLDASNKEIGRVSKVFEERPEIKEAFVETERTLRQRSRQGPSL